MSRPDASIAFLRDYGYCVFRFPRASAEPLELLHRDGKDLTRLGAVLRSRRRRQRDRAGRAP